MARVFSTVLNMSLTACFVILAVLCVRFLLRKAPRRFSYALWAVVLFRLLCPITLESPLSLLPTARPLAAVEQAVRPNAPSIPGVWDYTPNHVPNAAPKPVTADPVPALTVPDGTPTVPNSTQTTAPSSTPAKSTDPVAVAAAVWLCGVAAMAAYSALSLLRLRRRLVGAVPERDGVWIADHISTPFVLGLVRPRIYLPSALGEGERDYILLHERTHIRRGDHIVKALAFAALAVHWFNPLVWLAFRLAGRDMEMSCDEAVLRRMDRDVRADYSSSLLRLSAGKRLPTGPLAFGDGDPQSRIKNVMNYKKPALWVVALALAAVLAACTALSTDPAGNPGSTPGPIDLSDLSAELEFLPSDGEDQILPNIRLLGSVNGHEMGRDAFSGDRVFWWPRGDSERYPLGHLSFPRCNADYSRNYDDCGLLKACWTDETRTAVRLDNWFLAMISSQAGQKWFDVTVTLSGQSGSVTERNTYGSAGTFNELSDEEAVALARLAAKLLTAAEDYYNDSGLNWSQELEQDSSAQTKAQWDEVLAPYAPFGLTWEFDDPDLDGNGLTMWFDGRVVRGIMDYETGTWITEHIGDGFPEGAVELIAVYTDEKLTGLRLATAEEQAQFDLTRAQNSRENELAGKLTFEMDDTPYGEWDYGFAVRGLEAEGLTWYPPGQSKNGIHDLGLLNFEDAAFLGSYFKDRHIKGSAWWANTDQSTITVSFLCFGPDGDGIPDLTATYSVQIANSRVLERGIHDELGEEALLTDEALGSAGLALAQIMTAGERHWYDIGNPICNYPVAPVDSLPFAVPLEMEFLSGAGGWRTYLTLNPDGTFTGDYSDSDMGGSPPTRYVCQFHGRFGDFTQLSDNSWSLTLKELVIDTGHPVGEKWIEQVDGHNIQFISSDPYGFDGKDGDALEPGAQFTLYAPAAKGYAPGDELYGANSGNEDYNSTMYQFWHWWPDRRDWTPDSTLGCWGLCNLATGQGFFTENVFSWEEERALHTGQPGVKESGFVHSQPYDMDALPTVEYVAQEVTVDYDRVAQYYDPQTHINKFVFYKLDAAGGGQTVYMTNYGETKMIVYGE